MKMWEYCTMHSSAKKSSLTVGLTNLSTKSSPEYPKSKNNCNVSGFFMIHVPSFGWLRNLTGQC
jgi:hypothetical protein